MQTFEKKITNANKEREQLLVYFEFNIIILSIQLPTNYKIKLMLC